MRAQLSTSRPVLAVTGLSVEARIAAGPAVRALAGGGSATALVAALERELARGASAVISFGIAGGLAEGVSCGTWIIARSVVTPSQRWPCDTQWVRVLADRLPGAQVAELAGVDTPVSAKAAKRELHRSTGAVAVDTESHIAAALAAARGLPFAALRVVSDDAQRGLPPVAAVALAPDGRINGRAVLHSLARAPAQIPSLLRTAIDARTALRELSRGRRLLGPGLGYPDLGEFLLDVP